MSVKHVAACTVCLIFVIVVFITFFLIVSKEVCVLRNTQSNHDLHSLSIVLLVLL